jgi:hypothetical protein
MWSGGFLIFQTIPMGAGASCVCICERERESENNKKKLSQPAAISIRGAAYINPVIGDFGRWFSAARLINTIPQFVCMPIRRADASH